MYSRGLTSLCTRTKSGLKNRKLAHLVPQLFYAFLAPLQLIDKPSGNLDSLNEAVILKSLLGEDDDKTVALVSHRSSTMRICDVAYSVENGRMS